ncbi:response regulator [Halalkalibacter nanhaiisediminis]|uniref:Two-component system chemotaxis response regulator CheY n=1 Tax=Halalkalibacter nanhaiisediminis TaxID=688079 RepID=A0A562QHX0_9BACI|nr:response regulator [Halalkalibacter nanhaiisediminis]TWI56331.1 two-component system chemotaxis response regulator CheY [Halalkalibacter nanhaiisediminis]
MYQVLFCDDNETFRNQLYNILKKSGKFKVLGFESGGELIRFYKTEPKTIQNEHLIFIDCVMIDMSGFDTLQRILEFNPEAIVIMMTGKHQKNIIDGIKLGAKWFIWKPFEEKNIKEALGKFNFIRENL